MFDNVVERRGCRENGSGSLIVIKNRFLSVSRLKASGAPYGERWKSIKLIRYDDVILTRG